MHRPFRCPILVSAAVIGVGAVALAVYYFWKSQKTSAATSSESSASSISTSSRAAGGKDEDETMFNIDDEEVRKVCEKLFLEQMDLGEAYLEDEETSELGAMHLANALALTGETAQLLRVLRGSISPANFAQIQKYVPTAEMRVNQLLQDELSVETITQHFG